MAEIDEKMITEAATTAISDLQFDCEVAGVYRRADKKLWCVKFSGGYGEFCDEFRDRFGKENSPQVLREKLKRFLLKKPKPTGRRRGVSRPAPGASGTGNSLLDLPLQIAEGALEQTARAAGEVIKGTLDAVGNALQTVTDAARAAGENATRLPGALTPEVRTSIAVEAVDQAPAPPQPPTPPVIVAVEEPTTRTEIEIPIKSATEQGTGNETRRTTKSAAKKAAKRSAASSARSGKSPARKTSAKKSAKKGTRKL